MAIMAEFHGGPKDGLIQEIDSAYSKFQFPRINNIVHMLDIPPDKIPCPITYEYSLYKWSAEAQVAFYRYTGER